MILWSLWKHKNLKSWQQVQETNALVERVVHMLEDHKLAQEVRTSARTTEAQNLNYDQAKLTLKPSIFFTTKV